MRRGQNGSLDPADWESVRQFGYRAVDDMLAYTRDVRIRPVWQPLPEAAARVERPLPLEGESLERIYADFSEEILPYGLGNVHPRFWGWVIGSGTFTAAIADFLSAAMNTNAAGFNTSAVVVEERVLDWLRRMMRMPEGTGGILTSGASVANLLGLGAGLRAVLGQSYEQDGVRAAAGRPLVYASSETHFSVKRAVKLLGLGSASFRPIAADGCFQIDADALASAIAEDRERGLLPAMLVGNAGTVGVGAFDDLHRLADLAGEHGLWLHVDAAFGGMLALTAQSQRVAGLERADSLTIDLHKWLHIPIEAGCVLVRDAGALNTAYAVTGAYLKDMPAGPAVGTNRFTDRGLQQSRSARALKIWFSMREHGLRRLGECVEMNMRQAQWLAGQVTARPHLELLAPVTCNIVCFRCTPGWAAPADYDAITGEVLARIQCRGIALPSGYAVRGRQAIRCCITNHRTTEDDLRFFIEAVDCVLEEILRER